MLLSFRLNRYTGGKMQERSWDNAVCESFFDNLKRELVHHERFKKRQAVTVQVFEYIGGFYHRSRIHSAG